MISTRNTHGNLGKGPTDWELSQFGGTVEERLQHVAADSINFRGRSGVKKNEITQKIHDSYIHKVGMEMLEMLPGETKEEAEEKAAMAKKAARIGKTLQRRVRVSEMKDGGMSIAIDLEWDTTTWSTEEIEAACDALVMAFEQKPTTDRKKQALRMLTKLLERHTSAVKYLKADVENIMNKTINRRLIRGRSGGKLDLLHVLECCVSRYHADYCLFNYSGRFCEMALLEARLAAVLIQHTFRSQRELKNKRRTGVNVGPFAQGFGNASDIYRQRLKTINARTQTLKHFWRQMHEIIPKNAPPIMYGVRGPIHIGEEYMTSGLNTILHLVSSKTGKHAPDNREGIIKCNGLIFLSSFISATTSPFSIKACRIVSEVSKSS